MADSPQTRTRPRVEELRLTPVRGYSDAVLRFQRDVLNRCAMRLRLPLAIEDGWFGPETAHHCGDALWHLGVVEAPEPVHAITENDHLLLSDPFPEHDPRTERQQLAAQRRQRSLGPELTSDDLVCGVQLLHLIVDWDTWTHRRVDDVTFSPEDENTLVHRRTMEFVLPATSGEQAPGPSLVPFMFADKWNTPRFDLRDEAGRRLPVPPRARALAWSASALIAAADVAMGQPDVIPQAIEEDLRAIVCDDPSVALRVCHLLGTSVGDEASAEERELVALWRRTLVTNEMFMELAFDFAKHFLVMVMLPGGRDVPRMVVGTHQPGSNLFPSKPLAQGVRGVAETLRAYWRNDDWPLRKGDPRAHDLGQLGIAVTCEEPMVGSHQPGERLACADVTIVAENGEALSVTLRTNDVFLRNNVPPGRYRIEVRPRPGFRLVGETDLSLTLGPLGSAHASLLFVRTRLVDGILEGHEGIPAGAPQDRWRKRVVRALGWRSQQFLIKVKASDGHSYHFEFEAPSGLQITRAKLADERLGVLDIALGSCQRTHLYAPARLGTPGSAFALINLRPRGDTMVRSSALTATIVAVMITAVLVRMCTGEELNPTAGALVLAIPGGLAAYVSQAVPNRVTEKLLFGLRMMALVPALLAVIAAGVIGLGGDGPRSEIAFAVLAVLASLVAICSLATLIFTAWRPEKRPTAKAQGRGFAALHGRRTPTG